MPITLPSPSRLKRQWRQQILGRRTGCLIEARKGLVSLAFVDQSRMDTPFVEINSLRVYVLYEEDIQCPAGRINGRTALRLSVYRASRIPHGVLFGGEENNVLQKNLVLAPNLEARGQRIDVRKTDLLRMALELDSWLTLAARHPGLRRARLRLPKLWAGFRSRDFTSVQGGGPEFEKACASSELTSNELLERNKRMFEGLVLIPLPWVSGRLDDAVAVFAEMGSIPRRQVTRLAKFPEDLSGFWESSQYDFYHSRFRRGWKQCSGEHSHVWGSLNAHSTPDQLSVLPI